MHRQITGKLVIATHNPGKLAEMRELVNKAFADGVIESPQELEAWLDAIDRFEKSISGVGEAFRNATDLMLFAFDSLARSADDGSKAQRTFAIAAEVAKLLKKGAVLVDVRSRLEAKIGMAPGATNIPLLKLKSHLKELPRDRVIVTYCGTGGRAAKAVEILEANGFKAANGGGYKAILKILEGK